MFLLLINFKGPFTYNGTEREHTALAAEGCCVEKYVKNGAWTTSEMLRLKKNGRNIRKT